MSYTNIFENFIDKTMLVKRTFRKKWHHKANKIKLVARGNKNKHYFVKQNTILCLYL